MNEVLDQIAVEYPQATAERRAELDEHLGILKGMSETCRKEWLRFDDKHRAFLSSLQMHALTPAIPQGVPVVSDKMTERFLRGQGYYKLNMFEEAVREFADLVNDQPDFVMGRMFLAMGYLRTGQLEEARRHFQLLLATTENTTLRAISYSAMGCIQVHHQNLDQAYRYFQMADLADENCLEPAMVQQFGPYLRT